MIWLGMAVNGSRFRDGSDANGVCARENFCTRLMFPTTDLVRMLGGPQVIRYPQALR